MADSQRLRDRATELSPRKKFIEDTGNVIRQAEMLKKLGVKPTKILPQAWLEGSTEHPHVAPKLPAD